MDGQAVLYQGQVFENETHARWAVFLDSLRLDWQYKPQGTTHTAYGGERHAPTFFLGSREAYFVVTDEDPAVSHERIRADQIWAAKLATGTVRGVVLVHGTPDSYWPMIFHAKAIAEPEMHDWLEAAPESIKSLGWHGLPEELVIPKRSLLPEHFAWIHRGVGLDFWNGQLVVVTYEHGFETELREDPVYGQQVEVELLGHASYAAYGLDDPYEPLYVENDAYGFQPQPEYLAAITAATNAKFTARPHSDTLN